MDTINTISLILFIIFFGSYLLKLHILYKKDGIKANVLGKRGKIKTLHTTEILVKTVTLIWGISWFIFSIAETKIRILTFSFAGNQFIRFTGIILMAIGVALFIISMVSMKTSWRVGIDKESKSALVTSGLYKYSRNPAFIGFYTMFLGFLLVFINLYSLLITVLCFITIHRLILQEECHLENAYGEAYIKYKGRTPRYILFK